MPSNIILSAPARTPFGDFGKSLRDTPLTALAVHAARASLHRSGLRPDDIDHLVYANTVPVDPDSLFGARVISVAMGLPDDVAALTVSRGCGAGLQAIVSAAEQILSGHSSIALAGGAENYSRAPFILRSGRWGHKRGDQNLQDLLENTYRDPFSREYMGETAENIAREYGYTREQMDDWALMSQQRAGEAIRSGFLARQIAPIERVFEGKRSMMETDEFPRPDITLARLQQLRPSFAADGTVTPGNASGVTDGAAFIVVAEVQAAATRGLQAQARIVDWSTIGVAPSMMGIGPVPAVRKLLARTGLSIAEIDYFEVNEAFAVVNLHAERELNLPRERTNLYGGGISIGHPPGATGLRMTMTAMHHLQDTGGRYAVITMCIGAGQGMALLLENLLR
jgi:acetyl-CoA acetyltransferase family protein